MNFFKKIWFELSNLGIDDSTPASERKYIRILNQVNVFLFLEIPLYIIVHFFTDWRLSIVLFVIGLGFLSNLLFNRFGLFSIAKIGTYFWFWLIVYVFCIFLGEKSGISHTFYLLALLPFVMYSVKDKFKIGVLVSISALSFLGFYALRHFYPPLIGFVILNEEQQYYLFIPITLTVFVILSALVATLKTHNEQAETELLENLQETKELVKQTEIQNEDLSQKEKELQQLLHEVEESKHELIEKNHELQAQEEEMRQTVEELSSVNEQMAQQEEKLRLQIDENKLQLYQIEQQEELMRKAFEDLQEKTEQMEIQEQIMAQAMEEMNRINLQLQESEQRLEAEVKRRTSQIESQNKALEKSYHVLDNQTRTLRESIQYAKHIQNAILPPLQIIQGFFQDSFVFYRPRDVVSGDFYWIQRKVDKNGNMRIAMAAIDCTGHGVPGAIMSMIGYNLLNQYANEATLAQPNLLIQKLHEGVVQALQQRQTESHDGMDLALCVYDTGQQTIDFVGAKNPLIYIQNNQLHEIKGDNASVGGIFFANRQTKFTKHTIDVSIPTAIYIYSDGFQDQFGGESGRKFMKGRFKELLLEHHQKPMQEQQHIIKTTFDTWKRKHEQVDDVLLMGFRVN